MEDNQTKMQIQDALLELMKTNDISKIHIKEITDIVGITRGAFYIYYDSIYDVLEEIENIIFDGVREINKTFIQVRLSDLFKKPQPNMVKTLQFLKDNSKISCVLWGPHGDTAFQYKCIKFIKEYLVGKILFDNMITKNTDIASEVIAEGHAAAIRYWLKNRIDMDINELALLMCKLIFGGFFV
jgi:AcrR family transcriptional regulator